MIRSNVTKKPEGERKVKYYGVNELRKMFLDFFESKGHLVMKSFSLVPHNDNSLLLINAGMAPLKPYFTGQEIPPCTRVATCQKCIRTGDIENVGKTARHGTFFEMLGNFSFGDYFKKEAITWTWEFLTEVVGLDKDRLYPSVYEEDDEAFDLWHNMIGIEADRIFRFGKEDNFWEHGSGPCGPCSEVYYDRGEKYGCGKPGCTVGCDCDRYMEVWNDVFTQFDGDGHGNYTELENKNIDTGMGLERLAVVVQDVDSIFNVDTIRSLLDRVAEMAGKKYGENEKTDISLRLITDHIRSCTFMISDGITPSNNGRGYVLRRLLRRAARHGKAIGIDGLFLANLCDTVIEGSKDGYPELDEKREMIRKVLTEEEERFAKTIDQGLAILEGMIEKLEAEGKTQLSGEDSFKLYDTYGFPTDLTADVLEERGMTFDEEGYAACMEEQRQKARAARKATNYMGADETVYQQIDPALTSEFVGYDKLECDSEITVMCSDESIVDALADGDIGTILTKQSPFYATMGGQKNDVGVIESANGRFEVLDVIKLQGDKFGHIGRVVSGMFTTGETVTLKVDAAARRATAKNHSATHLLQKALRNVLGPHVEQAGSYVGPDRLRFDFTHSQAMTAEELAEVTRQVNADIADDYVTDTQVMSLDEAKKTGAMALFGEKYGEEVRVVKMGDSVELCGGTHIDRTGNIAAFKILSESGIAAGVRRIEALTGDGVMKYYEGVEGELNEAAQAAKTAPADLAKRIRAMQAEIKALQNENEKLKEDAAKSSLGDVTDKAVEVNGFKVLCAEIPAMDMNALRNLSDELKDKLGDCVVVLASAAEGKVSLLTAASEAAVKKGAHAGNIIKAAAPLVGGGGGGRPNMAQAGGKDPAGIPAALEKALEEIKSALD